MVFLLLEMGIQTFERENENIPCTCGISKNHGYTSIMCVCVLYVCLYLSSSFSHSEWHCLTEFPVMMKMFCVHVVHYFTRHI